MVVSGHVPILNTVRDGLSGKLLGLRKGVRNYYFLVFSDSVDRVPKPQFNDNDWSNILPNWVYGVATVTTHKEMCSNFQTSIPIYLTI